MPVEAPVCWEGKKYKLVYNKNWDEYLRALGVGLVLRKMCNTCRPVVELKKTGSTYNFATILEEKPCNLTFKLDEEFDEETFDRRQAKSIISLNGNTLVHVQKTADLNTKITREFHRDKMVATYIVKGVQAMRLYEALE